jgi:hypothetical protein
MGGTRRRQGAQPASVLGGRGQQVLKRVACGLTRCVLTHEPSGP